MSKIREVIKLNGGYTDIVDLTNQYFDEEINNQLMQRYKPIKAHRVAFERIANSLNQQDKRCYFLSGCYGTGSQHGYL